MALPFSNLIRQPVLVAGCARSSVRTGFSGAWRIRRPSSIMMPAWNAGPVPGTVPPGPSLSIPMTAAVARAISSTVGLPSLPEKKLQDAAADRPALNDRGMSSSFSQYILERC